MQYDIQASLPAMHCPICFENRVSMFLLDIVGIGFVMSASCIALHALVLFAGGHSAAKTMRKLLTYWTATLSFQLSSSSQQVCT